VLSVVYTSLMSAECDDNFIGEEERKRRRLMKKRAGMLKPVLRSEAMKQLDPFVTYTSERISQFTIYGMISWTAKWRRCVEGILTLYASLTKMK